MAQKLLNLTGERYGKLTVIARVPTPKGESKWKCRCDCGAICEVFSTRLRNAAVKACRQCKPPKRIQ